MIEFLASLPTYASDTAARTVWSWLQVAFEKDRVTGVCYYKHTVIRTPQGIIPELVLLTQQFRPVIVRCLPYQLNEIRSADGVSWSINGTSNDSPLLELDDCVVAFEGKFERDRMLRNKLKPIPVLALPLITRRDFEAKFGEGLIDAAVIAIWADGQVEGIIQELGSALNEQEWRHARSTAQGVSPLKPGSFTGQETATTLSEAMRILERQIALLDAEQEKAAIQIAPGPQRIRGLAGTGKTVLLAMKAANIHQHFPDKRILFSFSTQSLYNQTRALITKFYRMNNDEDPNWDMLHVRHAWGGRSKPGIYSELCNRHGVQPFTLSGARARKHRYPFLACCEHALSIDIHPYYDFILVDEAQDFPKEFFRILYKLSTEQHCIYWAYDELQSLSDMDIPGPGELFGTDQDGQPLVVLDDEPYPGGIDKDYVLNKSYRCPQQVLMVAHALGLGLYNEKGRFQMLENKQSWEAIGYIVESGALRTGEQVVIYRPPANSLNPISEIYRGTQPLIEAVVFQDRNEELDWVTQSIAHNIAHEGVPPEQIVVICLDQTKMKTLLPDVRERLRVHNVASVIPGLDDSADSFAETGHVTLATVFRAKGNEANIVYIFDFDALYDYVEAIEHRNRAFTSISRSRAWVRITGVGSNMQQAKDEVERILADQPRFKFKFPNMAAIRRLDAETGKRRREIRTVRDNFSRLAEQNPQAIATVADAQPELIEDVLSKLQETRPELLEEMLRRLQEGKRSNSE